MATTDEITALIVARIKNIFSTQPQTAALGELRAEVTSNLTAAVIDKVAAGATLPDAVDAAVAEFGDIQELVQDVLAETAAASATPVQTGRDAIAVDGKIIGVDVTAAEVAGLQQHTNLATDTFSDAAADKADNEMLHDLRGVIEIQVDYTYDDIRVLPIDGSVLRVQESFKKFKPEYAGTIEQAGGTVRVLHGKRPRPKLRFYINGTKLGFWAQILIGIPASFKGKLQIRDVAGDVRVLNLRELTELNVRANDGNIDLNYLAVQHLAATTDDGTLTLQGSQLAEALLASHDGSLVIKQNALTTLAATTDDGNMQLANLNLRGAGQFATRDGEIEADSVRGSELQLLSQDGNLRMTDLVANKMSLQTRDGNLVAHDLRGETVLHSGDGNIDATWLAVTGDISATTSDGSIHLTLPSAASYNFNLHAGDGRVTQDERATEFAKRGKHRRRGQKGDAPTFNLLAETGDGNITVR